MKGKIRSVGLLERCCGVLVALATFTLAGCSSHLPGGDAEHAVTRSAATPLTSPPTWPEFATLPRYRHAGAELGGGRALVCGGKDNTDTYPPNCELLEIQGSTLTSTVYSLPGDTVAQGRINATLTLLPAGGVVLVGGRPGPNNLELAARASLPVSNWSTSSSPSSNWLASETMNVVREGHTATLLGTSVVVVGGYNRATNSAVGQIEIRTDDGSTQASWNAISALEPRQGHTATLLKPKAPGSEARLLVLGGFDVARGGSLKSGFIFSIANGIQAIADMPSPRMSHTATLLNDAAGSVLVVGGENVNQSGVSIAPYLADAWLYNPDTNVWTVTGAAGATPLVPRKYHSASLLGSAVIIAGGEGAGAPGANNGEALQSVQSYDWQHDTWSDLRPLTKGREYFQLLKLSETELVASGGWRVNGSDALATSELITLGALGQPSTDGTVCGSRHEADGVCCESDCAGSCEACDVSGVCQKTSGVSPSGHPTCDGHILCALGTCPAQCDSTQPCADGYFCDGGTCTAKKEIGIRCQAASECAGGAPCVDGFCCESDCTGSCESCDQASHPGLCLTLAAGAAPEPSHPPCSSAGDGNPSCAARCDGSHAAACVFPGPASECAAASCEDSNFQPTRACDGQGTCQAVAAQSCAPYACSASECLHSCGGDADCSSGAHCNSGTCVRCDESECNGYQCDGQKDECRTTCRKSETDCVGGYYCHPLKHQCVLAVPFPAAELASCALGRHASKDSAGRLARGGLSSAAALCFWLSARRRRRRTNAGRSARQSPR